MNLITLKERVALAPQFNPEERDFILKAINDATGEFIMNDAIVHDPGNYLGRIDYIWAYLSIDDGGEGVCAAPTSPGMLSVPMIAADKRRVDSLRPFARLIARATSKPVRLAKFSKREDIEIIRP